ncbi:hypothetical protein [Litchfieldella anticariensis]|uniref:hypothetical protein n=1 Tax=Litchfieldella anticariensis TaxID=258591 RepID=UPI0011845283|nr:hypothetical protein [Halomonas anticariensis]
MKTNFIKLSRLLVPVCLFFFSAQATAEECTSMMSVQISHFVTHNNDYGGHLNAHVLGQSPPNGFTQNGKTIFRDSHDWEDAYSALENQEPGLQCNPNAPIGSEAARTLPRQYFSYQCTAADAQDRCTNGNEIQTNHVTYVFRVMQNGAGKRWIVYTAYPTPQ